MKKNILVLLRMARRIQRLPGNELCVGHVILAGRVPRIQWAQSHCVWRYYDAVCSILIALAFTQKRHHQNRSVILIIQNVYCQGKVMKNVHLHTEYVVIFRNSQYKRQFGHLAWQLEPKHSKALVNAILWPYLYLLVDMKPHTPDALRYRSNYRQLDRQSVYVIGAVPTCATRRHIWPPQVRARGPLRRKYYVIVIFIFNNLNRK